MSKITVSEIESPSSSPITINSGINFNIPIRVKNYTTAEINALTGNLVGDLVYDSTVDLLKVFNGSDWDEVGGLPNAFDVINEESLGTGVTVDGVLHRDNQVYTDVINELTDQAGVEVDGVLLKDRTISADVINEKLSNTGVTIEGTLFKDGDATVAGNALPDQDDTHDLGTSGQQWSNLWLGTGLKMGVHTVTHDANSIIFPNKLAVDEIVEKTAAAGTTFTNKVIFEGDIDAQNVGTVAGLPTGAIEKVAQSVWSGEQNYSSISTFTDVHSDLDVTIIPATVNSKFLLIGQIVCSVSGTTTVNFRFTRNNTGIGLGDTGSTGQTGWRTFNSSTAWASTTTGVYVDEPATTSQLTYRIQFRPYDSSRNTTFNNSYNGGSGDDYRGISSLTVLELKS